MYTTKLQAFISFWAVLLCDAVGFRLSGGIKLSRNRRPTYRQPDMRKKISSPLALGRHSVAPDIRNINELTPRSRYPLHLRGGATVVLSAASAAPALSVWIGPALACALSYALYNLFIKRASASMDPILGGVLLQIVAAALGAGLLVIQRARATAPLEVSKLGVRWAVAAGAAVGAAEILSFIISGIGVPASKSIPAIIGGSVVIGTLLGAVWLGEQLTRRGWVGVAFIALGIALVGIDPGASLH